VKNILLGGLALAALFSGSAIAADMPVKARPVVETFSWTGCYLGSLVGGKWSRHNATSTGNINGVNGGPTVTNVPLTNTYERADGYLSGAELGCNYQFGNAVVGIEGDWAWSNLIGERFETATFTPTYRHDVNEKSIATLRGRLGFLIRPRALIYVTGGGAWARIEDSLWSAPLGGPLTAQVNLNNETQTFTGWTAGGGFELAFQGPTLFNMGGYYSAKAEYLYMDMRDKVFFTTVPTTCTAC